MPETPPDRKRFHWLKRDVIDLGDAAVQFVAVLVGVLLALFISQWNNQRQQQATARKAMFAIHAELATNRANLHASAASISAMARHMQSAPENQNQPPRQCDMWSGWQETGVVLLDAAYQTAIATQALAHMPFKQAQHIAQAYGYQQANLRAFSVIRDKFFIAQPYPLAACIHFLGVFASNERLASSAYTPLIGPDKIKWPTLPSNTPSRTNPPK